MNVTNNKFAGGAPSIKRQTCLYLF